MVMESWSKWLHVNQTSCFKKKTLTGDMLSRADVDQDGKIEANDYMLIKLHVLGRKLLF